MQIARLLPFHTLTRTNYYIPNAEHHNTPLIHLMLSMLWKTVYQFLIQILKADGIVKKN